MKFYKQLILLYIELFLAFLLSFVLTKNISNYLLLSLLLGLIFIAVYSSYKMITKENILLIGDKSSIRYSMHCRNCGWEWMSNTSDHTPSICPNCKSKDRLEVIGWRKVNISSQKKTEKDLRNFFKF